MSGKAQNIQFYNKKESQPDIPITFILIKVYTVYGRQYFIINILFQSELNCFKNEIYLSGVAVSHSVATGESHSFEEISDSELDAMTILNCYSLVGINFRGN